MAKVKGIITKYQTLFIFFWLPIILWMGLIYFLSSFHKLQASPVGWQDFIFRKTAHFTEYAILNILCYRALKNTTKLNLAKILFWSFLITFLYALSDEYHQTFVSGRTGRFFDIGIDSMGNLFGLLFSWKLIYFLPRKIRGIVLS